MSLTNLIEKLLIKRGEKPLSNYIISNGELHNADELVHWKYIKREKMPNGKWRYYYDDPLDAKYKAGHAKYELEIAKRNKEAAKKAENDLRSIERDYGKDVRDMAEASRRPAGRKESFKEYQLAKRENKKQQNIYNSKKNDTIVNDVKKAVKKVDKKIDDVVDKVKKTTKNESEKKPSKKSVDLNAKKPDYSYEEYNPSTNKTTKYTLTETDTLTSKHTRYSVGDTEYVTLKRGKVDRYIDNGQKYIDEWLKGKRR